MFRFSLESVLDQRRTMEEARQRALAEGRTVVSRLEAERLTLSEKVSLNLFAVQEAIRRGESPAQRELYDNWIEWARDRIARIDRELERARQEVERRRLALVEAAKARMMMDKLREKELEAYRKEEELQERNFFDELASREFDRRRREAKVAREEERIAR